LETKLRGDFTALTAPPPASGLIMSFMLELLSELSLEIPDAFSLNSVATYQRIVESFKHAYAKRTLLGDPFDPLIKDKVEQVRRFKTTVLSLCMCIM